MEQALPERFHAILSHGGMDKVVRALFRRGSRDYGTDLGSPPNASESAENTLEKIVESLENISLQMERIEPGGLEFLFAGLGSLAALGVLLWTLVNAFRSYLHLDLSLNLREEGSLSALTIAENRSLGLMRKKINNAILLVGPESESPIRTFNRIACHEGHGDRFKTTNAIAAYQGHGDDIQRGPEGRLLIPLPFYYSENIGIKDERVSYRSPIDTRSIPRGIPYSVRFFIDPYESKLRQFFGKCLTFLRLYHRSTHDSFVLP